MAPSPSSIFDDVDGKSLPSVVKTSLVAGPVATVGYAISTTVQNGQSALGDVIRTLGDVTTGALNGTFGSFPTILNAGAEGTASSLGADWGVLAFLVAVVIVLAALWMIQAVLDRIDQETLTGLPVPFMDRFQDEEEG